MIFFFTLKKERVSSQYAERLKYKRQHASGWNIHDQWVEAMREREIERETERPTDNERSMENSCHFHLSIRSNLHGVCALFQDSCAPPAPVDSLNLRNRKHSSSHSSLPLLVPFATSTPPFMFSFASRSFTITAPKSECWSYLCSMNKIWIQI